MYSLSKWKWTDAIHAEIFQLVDDRLYANIFSVNYHVHAFINNTKQQACLKQNTPCTNTFDKLPIWAIYDRTNKQFQYCCRAFWSNHWFNAPTNGYFVWIKPCWRDTYRIAVNSTLLLLQAHNRLIKHWMLVCVSEWIVCVHVLNSLWLLINLLLFIAHDPTQANY